MTTPSRNEFVLMLQLCAEDKDRSDSAGDDARLYLFSERCLRLCRKYLTGEPPPTEGGLPA